MEINLYPQVDGKPLKHFKQASNIMRFVIQEKKNAYDSLGDELREGK